MTEKEIYNALQKVMDPEIGCSIVDLGLIYKVKTTPRLRSGQAEYDVEIDMTLTAPGCPLAQMIDEQIKEALKKIKGVEEVKIKMVFDPPWTPEKMSPALKKKMGF